MIAIYGIYSKELKILNELSISFKYEFLKKYAIT